MRGQFAKRKLKYAWQWISKRPYYLRRAYNRMFIRNRNFTIISNNCWAGKVYQYLDMPYLSPTVGLYFFAEDYLKFVSNLKYYLSLDLEFISVEKSQYKEILQERKQIHIPVARLDDVELFFLHYTSEEEAREKWERRKGRVNYNNIYIKFSNMNLCTEEIMEQFDGLPFSNKFMLNNRKKKKYSCEIYWKTSEKKNEILNDTSTFPGNLCLRKLLNCQAVGYPQEGFPIN